MKHLHEKQNLQEPLRNHRIELSVEDVSVIVHGPTLLRRRLSHGPTLHESASLSLEDVKYSVLSKIFERVSRRRLSHCTAEFVLH